MLDLNNLGPVFYFILGTFGLTLFFWSIRKPKIIPYILIFPIMLESFPLFRVISIEMGEKFSMSRIFFLLCVASALISQRGKVIPYMSKWVSFPLIVVIYFSLTLSWAEEPGIGALFQMIFLAVLFLFVCSLTEKENFSKYFFEASLLAGVILSIFSVLAFFGIGYAGKYGILNEGYGFIRTRPFNLNSNTASYYIATLNIPVIVELFLRSNVMAYRRNTLFAVLGLNLMGVLGTGSLSGTVFFLSGIGIAWILAARSGRIGSQIIMLVVLLGCVGGLAGLSGHMQNIEDRLEQTSTDIGRQKQEFLGGTYGGRGYIWNAALEFFEEAPLLGTGLGTFAQRHNGYAFHNSLIWALNSGGIVGFLLWLSIFGIYLAFGWRTRRTARVAQVLAITFLLGSLAYSMLHDIHFNKLFWLYLGLVAGLLNRETISLRREIRNNF